MNGLANSVLPSERKGYIADTTGDQRTRAGFLDTLCGFDKIDAVAVVLFDTRGDRENIGIKNNIFRWETDLSCQQVPGSFTETDTFLQAVGLAVFIECHDDDRCAETQYRSGLFDKHGLTFFQADRINHALSLQAGESGFQHFPTG